MSQLIAVFRWQLQPTPFVAIVLFSSPSSMMHSHISLTRTPCPQPPQNIAWLYNSGTRLSVGMD